MCTTFLVKPRSNSEPKIIIYLSHCRSVNSENRASRELLCHAPEPNCLSKNSQNFTGDTWLSYLKLSCWTLSQKMLLSWSKNLNDQTAIFWNLTRLPWAELSKNFQIFTAENILVLIHFISQAQLDLIYFSIFKNLSYSDFSRIVLIV